MGFFDSWKIKTSVYLKHSVVFPGNIVEGYVQIVNDSSSSIEFVAIRAKLTGKEKVRLEENFQGHENDFTQDGHQQRAAKKIYEETHVYHKHLLTLAGHMKQTGQRSPSFQLPPGKYTYPFAFQLPSNVPASFEQQDHDTKGLIQYYVKAYVDIPGGRDASAKQHFTVLSAMPATQHDQQAGNFTQDKQFDVSCCCFSKGSVSARIYCTRTTVAVDRDQLLVCADVNNQAGEEPVNGMDVSLTNCITLRAQGHEGKINNIVARQNIKPEQGSPILPGQCGRIRGVLTIHSKQHANGQQQVGNLSGGEFVPTFNSMTLSSVYTVDLSLDVPNAFDPEANFPAIVTHCVDTTNFLPPLSLNAAAVHCYPQGCPPLREDFYYPPQNPVFQHTPVPNAFYGQMPPPPPPPQQQPFLYQPPANFFPPTTHYNNEQYKPLAQGQQHWQGGVHYQTMAPPPLGTI